MKIPSSGRNSSNSHNGSAGCLSGILRWLLCTGSLSANQSDHIKAAHQVECDCKSVSKPIEKNGASVTPGIVARLMGLESMPEIGLIKVPHSISRSRSVNHTDYLSEFNPTQGWHRRARTSLSFREAPTFLLLENEDAFLLSFDDAGDIDKFRSKGRKLEMGIGELKQKKAERCNDEERKTEKEPGNRSKIKKKEVQLSKKVVFNENKKPRRVISDKVPRRIKDSGLAPPHKKEVCRKPRVAPKADNLPRPKNRKEPSNGTMKTTKKKKKSWSAAKKVEPEWNLENSSPLSVFDARDFIRDSQTTLAEEDSRSAPSSLRRKLSPELANFEYPTPDFTRSSLRDARKSRSLKLEHKESSREHRIDSWGGILKLNEDDVDGSNWISGKWSKLEDIEEIGFEFELQILGSLVHEIVYELVRVP